MRRIVWCGLVCAALSLAGNSWAQGVPEFSWVAGTGLHGLDDVNDVAVADDGSAYLVGYSMPYPGMFRQAVITKVAADGSVAWHRVFGGQADNNEARAVAVDRTGDVVVLGSPSNDFPFTTGTQYATGMSQMLFVAKFTPEGNLVYAHGIGRDKTSFGGWALTISIDNEPIVGLNTQTSVSPQPGQLIHSYTNEIIRLDPTGASATVETVLPAGASSFIRAVHAGEENDVVYVSGMTAVANFPVTADAADASTNSTEGFFTVLRAGVPIYSTFIGGTGSDYVQAMAVDASRNVSLLVVTQSSDFPLGAHAGPGVNVVTFDPARQVTVMRVLPPYSARAYDMAVTADGGVYITGGASAGTAPLTPDAFSTDYYNGFAPFLLAFDRTTQSQAYGTLLTFAGDWGNSDDLQVPLALTPDGDLYVASSAYNPELLWEHPEWEPSFDCCYEEINDRNFKKNAFVVKLGGAAAAGNTPTGTAVTVESDSVSITFSEVTAQGDTVVAAIADPSELNLALPGNFRLADGVQAVEITTTAQVSGPILICFTANGLSDIEFLLAEVLHGVNGSWVSEPTIKDLATRRICATVSSLSPFAIGIGPDRTAPIITAGAPQGEHYLLNAVVTPEFACSDPESAVVTCSSQPVDTSIAGARTLVIRAVNGEGLTSLLDVNYTVGYGVTATFNQQHSYKSGSTVPIKLQLTDAGGANVSAASVSIATTQIVRVSSEAASAVQDAGQANADAAFRFTDGSYVFNLSTKGLAMGTYELRFLAGQDPKVHAVRFSIR